MKASEICIGDWFKAIDYNSPFRITAIYDDVVQTQADYQSEIDGNWYSEAYIKDLVPIELTEEILAKNGFLKRSGNEYYLKDDIVIFVGSDSCEVCTLYGECTAYSYVEEGYTTVATIHYVHQLQHLLRLVGVEKEIEL